MSRAPVRAFISYTHDTDDHRRRIARLADRLVADGIDARLDRIGTGTPMGGWPAWMEEEIEAADFIVLVCTATYHERYKGKGDIMSGGLGGRWEASLVRDLLYMSPLERLHRFVPVLPRNSTVEDIPLPLRVRVTHYRLDDYGGLLRHLTGPGQVSAEPVGGHRSRKRRVADRTDEASMRFSDEIRDGYRRIHQRVETLTREQYAVIAQLHGRPRALISGTPGSGKTLVAAEKAIRLAHAGISTLFVCHNPLLAEWIGTLTEGAPVDVRSFEDLVHAIVSGTGVATEGWTNYSGPTKDQLGAAVELLSSRPPRYQAVVVDEGQDFADDWWPVVEACLPRVPDATLYVFFDDRQSLLPYRTGLPPAGWPLNLSRNCRNAGRVYDVMRRLSPNSPLPDQQLRDLGHVDFFHETKLRDAVIAALRWFDELEMLDGVAAVLGGGVAFEHSVLAHGPFIHGDPMDWQGSVRLEMRKLVGFWSERLREKGIDPIALWKLDQLSDAPMPGKADLGIVSTAATTLASAMPAAFATFERPPLRWRPVRASGVDSVVWRLRGHRPKASHRDILKCAEVWHLGRLGPIPGNSRFCPSCCELSRRRAGVLAWRDQGAGARRDTPTDAGGRSAVHASSVRRGVTGSLRSRGGLR
jgi:hypothetical protein